MYSYACTSPDILNFHVAIILSLNLLKFSSFDSHELAQLRKAIATTILKPFISLTPCTQA